MAFTVEKNGKYTVYALNAEGVVALSTITISNITEFVDSTDKGDVTEPKEDTSSAENTDSAEDTDSGVFTESKDKDNTLPSTATNIFNLLLIGGTMLAVGFTFILLEEK